MEKKFYGTTLQSRYKIVYSCEHIINVTSKFIPIIIVKVDA